MSHIHSGRYKKPRFELADVLNRYLDSYLASHKLSRFQEKVVEAIQCCRTAKLGGHKWVCNSNECDYEREEYNSCRNRHCPKCQISKKIKWVRERLSELLPIPYYHTVFTMPHSLNALALYNKEVLYDIFFKATAHALNAFAQDPKFLGAKLGFIGILHTWGQTLCHHVHIHYIVPGGGISNDGSRWVSLPYRKDFLFPVRAVSRRVRRKFAELLQKAYDNNELVFPDTLTNLSNRKEFERFLKKVAWEKWISYVKKPFSGPEDVVAYIGRYTHRVAISNHRLLDINDGNVSFRYKKYHDNEAEYRTMKLTAEEFIRRFLLHVIPRGFKRIRHFGFLSNGCRTKYLELARTLLNDLAEKIEEVSDSFLDSYDETNFLKCPVCKSGILQPKPIILLAPG